MSNMNNDCLNVALDRITGPNDLPLSGIVRTYVNDLLGGEFDIQLGPDMLAAAMSTVGMKIPVVLITTGAYDYVAKCPTYTYQGTEYYGAEDGSIHSGGYLVLVAGRSSSGIYGAGHYYGLRDSSYRESGCAGLMKYIRENGNLHGIY
jgi:hypothetical protein